MGAETIDNDIMRYQAMVLRRKALEATYSNREKGEVYEVQVKHINNEMEYLRNRVINTISLLPVFKVELGNRVMYWSGEGENVLRYIFNNMGITEYKITRIQ